MAMSFAASALMSTPLAVRRFGGSARGLPSEKAKPLWGRVVGGVVVHHRASSGVVCPPARYSKPSSADRWSGFDPELVDLSQSIKTWEVFRIVLAAQLKRRVSEVSEFGDKLEGVAAEQCMTTVDAMKETMHLLEHVECSGPTCGFNQHREDEQNDMMPWHVEHVWEKSFERWSGYDPDLVHMSGSISTWNVFRIIEYNKVLKIQDELLEFSGKLEGQAAQQCWDVAGTLEKVKRALEQDCTESECGYMEKGDAYSP